MISGGGIYKSSNGNNWGNPAGSGYTNIAYGNDIWTAVTSGGTLWFLKNGLDAIINSNNTNNANFIDIAYGNGKWVVVRTKASLPVSFNTITTVKIDYKTITGIPTTPRFTTVGFRP